MVASLWGMRCVDDLDFFLHHLLSNVPELSSGLSFEQMVGFSFVHSLLGFLGCESWVRLTNTCLLGYMSTGTG